MRRFKRAAESVPTHALPFSKQATRVDHTVQHPAVETVFKSNREISNAKAEPGFFFVLRWGSKHHDVHIKCREFTDIVPDGLKTKRSMTFLLTKDTFSDARCVEDKGNFVLKIKQSKTGSACTHDVVFQTRWSSSKGVMLFSISSGLARASRGRLLARERKRCAHRLLPASRLCQAYQLIRSSTVWLRVA